MIINGDYLHSDEWEVKSCCLKKAKFLVEHFHYAKGGSNSAVYVHGLFRKSDNALFGIAWWLPPTKVACQSVNRDKWQKVLGLSRMVMIPGAPKNSCSFLLSKSVKLIKKEGRFVSLVTYADESQGHEGLVYRAANWQYVGKTGPYPRWLDSRTGRQISKKATVSRTNEQMKELGYFVQGNYFKHKFVLHLKANPSKTNLKNISDTET